MIRIISSCFRLIQTLPPKTHLCKSTFSTYYKIQTKTDLEKEASKLIFGDRQYGSLTPKEKRIVDLYQRKILKEDGGVVLPNTGADLEQKNISSIFSNKSTNNSTKR